VAPSGATLRAQDPAIASTIEVPAVHPSGTGGSDSVWHRANLAFGGWCLVAIALLLGVHRWRLIRGKQREEASAVDKKPALAGQPNDARYILSRDSPSTLSVELPDVSLQRAAPICGDRGLDLQLLRFLGDGTASGFRLQIDIYLKAFDSDRRLAHSIFAEGNARKIHGIAHRLVAHAGAVHFIPLVDLATTAQTNAATLNREQLDQLLREIDREFVNLTNILDAIRVSTERA
jgi:hypothetical protein